MKKAISILLALVMCLSLCACGDSQAESNNEQAKGETPVQTPSSAYDKQNLEEMLACLLFHHFQSVSVCVPHDIARAQFQNIADAQAQVPFQNKGGCDALIGSAAAEPLLHGLDDFGVLLCGQSLGFLVHGCLQWS